MVRLCLSDNGANYRRGKLAQAKHALVALEDVETQQRDSKLAEVRMAGRVVWSQN